MQNPVEGAWRLVEVLLAGAPPIGSTRRRNRVDRQLSIGDEIRGRDEALMNSLGMDPN
jgi:hypothetical protein